MNKMIKKVLKYRKKNIPIMSNYIWIDYFTLSELYFFLKNIILKIGLKVKI